jgi:hypothetical protein
VVSECHRKGAMGDRLSWWCRQITNAGNAAMEV